MEAGQNAGAGHGQKTTLSDIAHRTPQRSLIHNPAGSQHQTFPLRARAPFVASYSLSEENVPGFTEFLYLDA